jgi:hypothetical protein
VTGVQTCALPISHPDEAFPEHIGTLRRPGLRAQRWYHWFPVSTTLAGPMFRLLDVDGAWAVRRIRPGPPLSVAPDVTDAQIAENRGARRLLLADGRVRVMADDGLGDGDREGDRVGPGSVWGNDVSGDGDTGDGAAGDGGSGAGDGPPEIRLSIGIEPLSRIYIGALTPSAAVLAGLATVDRPELLAWLDALLALPKPWTFDRF